MTDSKTDHPFKPDQPPNIMALTLEQYDKLLAEARAEGAAEEREACIKDLCWMCRRESWSVSKHPFGDYFIHTHPKMSRQYDCLASAIRQRVAADTAKEQAG